MHPEEPRGYKRFYDSKASQSLQHLADKNQYLPLKFLRDFDNRNFSFHWRVSIVIFQFINFVLPLHEIGFLFNASQKKGKECNKYGTFHFKRIFDSHSTLWSFLQFLSKNCSLKSSPEAKLSIQLNKLQI